MQVSQGPDSVPLYLFSYRESHSHYCPKSDLLVINKHTAGQDTVRTEHKMTSKHAVGDCDDYHPMRTVPTKLFVQ